MSQTEQMEELIATTEKCLTDYLLKNPHKINMQAKEELTQQNTDDHHAKHIALLSRSVTMLISMKSENEELKLKASQLENVIEGKNAQIDNLNYEVGKLKEKINTFVQNEEQFKVEVQSLNSIINGKDSQLEDTQEEVRDSLSRIREENKMLIKQNEELLIKVSTCKKLIETQISKRQETDNELKNYINIQQKLQNTLTHLKEEYLSVIKTQQRQLQDRQQRINQLEQFISSKMIEERKQNSINNDNSFRDISTQYKLMRLSDQIGINQTTILPMDSMLENQNRERGPQTSRMEQQIQPQILASIEKPDSPLRKVFSSINCHRQSIDWEKRLTGAELSSVKNFFLTSFDTTDPYYLHYTLLVQSIKIEQDEEGLYGILDIDMKPYFNQIKLRKIAMGQWSGWIRQRLLQIHQKQRTKN